MWVFAKLVLLIAVILAGMLLFTPEAMAEDASEPVIAEQELQRLPEHVVVLNEQDPDGRRHPMDPIPPTAAGDS